MKIGIEIDWGHKAGGMRSVATNLLREIIKLDGRHEYCILTNTRMPEFSGTRALKQVVLPPPHPVLHHVWDQFILPQALFPRKFVQENVDLIYYTGTISPFYKVRRGVVLMHDLTIFTVPECYNRFHRAYQERYYRWAITNAEHIITVSESSKNDLLKLFGVRDDHVTAVPLGVSSDFRIIADQSLLDAVRRKYSLPGRFILNVGTIQPRKNLVRLINAFAKLRDELPHQLVIVGRRGWKSEEVFEAIARHHLEERVKYLGAVPKEDLPVIYNLAEIFVYPSLYEGFGLPVLEAMMSGVPSITSDNSSLAEVAGEAALLVEAESEESITQALKKLSSQADLRAELRTQGLARGREFSWQNTARRTLQVLERVHDRIAKQR